MKKLIARILGAVLAVVIIVGGRSCMNEMTMGSKIEELAGIWEMEVAVDSETVSEVLEYLDFYPDEIAMMDTGSMYCVKLVEFRQDKTYDFTYDVTASKELVRAYFEQAIADIYAGRDRLTAVYGAEVADMTQDEFQLFYAQMFGLEDFDALLDLYVENSLDFESMEEGLESGTYTIEGDTIMCTIDGETKAEGLGYTLKDDALTLTYINDKEEYTRRG